MKLTQTNTKFIIIANEQKRVAQSLRLSDSFLRLRFGKERENNANSLENTTKLHKLKFEEYY